MNDTMIDQVSWNGFRHVKGPVRGFVLRFRGLGDQTMKRAADWTDLEFANHGALVVEVFNNPWSWMNDELRDLTDAVVLGLRKRHGIAAGIPVLTTGFSMGGHAALTYCFRSRFPVAACSVFFPPCDLVRHFDERPDLPRTLYSAFGLREDIKAALKDYSPLHQVAKMSGIPCQIFHGDADASVSKKLHSDPFVSELRIRGQEVDYVEIPGMPHGVELPDYATARRYLDFIIGHLGQ